ncbi:elongation factor P--beta-lysine ligase [Streptacidiphilus sp. BW17]|uniref:hypothetical protein n=1 Tax=unclassified Streptacidiphilus TaxID=2643834 RepID=UPI0035129CB0
MASHLQSTALGGMVFCSLIALLVAFHSQRLAAAARRRAADLEKALLAANGQSRPLLTEDVGALATDPDMAGASVGVRQRAVLSLVGAIHAERARVDEALAALTAVVTGPCTGTGRMR